MNFKIGLCLLFILAPLLAMTEEKVDDPSAWLKCIKELHSNRIIDQAYFKNLDLAIVPAVQDGTRGFYEIDKSSIKFCTATPKGTQQNYFVLSRGNERQYISYSTPDNNPMFIQMTSTQPLPDLDARDIKILGQPFRLHGSEPLVPKCEAAKKRSQIFDRVSREIGAMVNDFSTDSQLEDDDIESKKRQVGQVLDACEAIPALRAAIDEVRKVDRIPQVSTSSTQPRVSK